MTKRRDFKLVLSDNGSYIGARKGCIYIKDKEGRESKYPLHEEVIGEIILNSGNAISTGALSSLAFCGVDVLVATRKGRPLAVLKDLDDDSHVDTRIGQYEAIKSSKGCSIAKEILAGKLEGQNNLLRKYGLKSNYLLIARALRRADSHNN